MTNDGAKVKSYHCASVLLYCAHLFIRRSIIYPDRKRVYIADLDATAWFCTDVVRFVLFLLLSTSLLFLPAASFSFFLAHIREPGHREAGSTRYYSGESLYSDYFQSAGDRWRFMWSWSQLTRLLGWLLAGRCLAELLGKGKVHIGRLKRGRAGSSFFFIYIYS